MDRPIYYSQEMWRSFDILEGYKDLLKGIGRFSQAVMGDLSTYMTGFSAAAKSVPNMQIDLAEGQIYEWHQVDDSPYGTLASDTTYIVQQGHADAQTLTFNTSQLAAGQSQWVLVRCRFLQQNLVRTGDPTDGVLPYYNSANPTVPLHGVNNDGNTQSTVRKGHAEISIVYGTPAATGSEVPPQVGGGYVPLYLILLTFGQTAITNGQIQVAGDATYPGYTEAPFWKGIRAQHHRGLIYGQAPQIVLGGLQKEVQGIMDLVNLPATNTVGLLPTIRSGTGDPNGVYAGNVGDLFIQTDGDQFWFCKVAGNAANAVWSPSGPVGAELITTFPTTITKSAGTFMLQLSSANGVVNLPTADKPRKLKFKSAHATQYKAILTPNGTDKIWRDNALLDTLDMLEGDSFELETITSQSRWYVM